MLSTNASGRRPHRLTLQNPGVPVPDGDGGYTQTYIDLSPAVVYAGIENATPSNMESFNQVGGMQTRATHLVRFPFHPGVTLQTRLLFNGHTLYVAGLINVDFRDQELLLAVEERVS